MLKLIQSIRKPPTPPSNRHQGRSIPRLTRNDLASMLEEEMDEEREELFFLHQTGRAE